MTVSTETVRMAKSRPRKNQSERSDLPCHIIKHVYVYKNVSAMERDHKNNNSSKNGTGVLTFGNMQDVVILLTLIISTAK